MMHQLSSMSIANAWATNADIATPTLTEKEIRLKALFEARRNDNLWKAKIAMDYSMGCKLGTTTDNKVVFSSAGVDTWAGVLNDWPELGCLLRETLSEAAMRSDIEIGEHHVLIIIIIELLCFAIFY